LLGIYSEVADDPQGIVCPQDDEIAELARLVVGPENADAADYILKLKDGGVSLDRLHLELLEPTARHLGDLWTDDKIDFIDVTIGVRRLQQLVHIFAGLDQVPQYDSKRRALIVATPGEQHSFGNTMLQRFFRSGGWYVYSNPGAELQHITALVAQQWIGIVGFSLSTDQNIDSLAASISAVRKMSRNRTVGIMVGGPAFIGKPELAFEIGADGTAANAPAAVILAKRLLVPSLLESV
jgi:methanogenic corrinoid protein MtbC1